MRWGHAFWAYIGARYGDRAVALLRSAANPRTDWDWARQLGTDPDTLTADWHASIRRSTAAVVGDAPPLSSEPRLVVSRDERRRYNIGPRVSPDGREIAFFPERGRFSIDLFVADATTGKVLRRLSRPRTIPTSTVSSSSTRRLLESDSKMLAIAAIRRGDR
jgi:hypothetical protein